jgi:hypothetical protein
MAGGCLFALIMAGVLPFSAAAQNIATQNPAADTEPAKEPFKGFFPSIYFTEYVHFLKTRDAASPYGALTEEELRAESQFYLPNRSLILNDDILAFYGHPLSNRMGILGRYSIEELSARLTSLAEEYDGVNGNRGIRKAFYIIYGTVWPQGEIGILKEEILLEYIQYALEQDILVFIDHQIGKYTPLEALKKILPYLRYPNVHLALDPEWRTTKPMEEIGGVTAEEINEVQRVMETYLTEHQIPGERMLVIHQFNWRMIRNRENVESGFEKVRLVHCADGFGNPSLKKQSYAYNAEAVNIPVKGFKLFYNFNIPGAGYDHPLLSPREVMELDPRPYIIMYQ